MSVKQIVIDKGFAASMREMENLGHLITKVGLPADGRLGSPSRSGENPPATDLSQVIKIAATHEFGGTINHPGGTAYKTIALPGQIKAVFISNSEADSFDRRTKPHSIKIPQRPFMRMSFDNNLSALQEFKKVRILAVARGKETAAQAIAKIGEWLTAKTKLTIRSGSFAPLRPATIKRKQSSKPLIDTGQMINSIQHVEGRV
jgi:hypothetical protein